MSHSSWNTKFLQGFRSIYCRTFAIFILLCFMGGWIVIIDTLNYIKTQKQIALQMAGAESNILSQRLNAAISMTYTLETILSENQFKIQPDRFKIFATHLINYQPSVSSLQYAPDGIVTYVVPLEGNESIIGHNLFDDPKRNKEAFDAEKKQILTVAGPFDLIQGGVGLVARLPIYQTENQPKKFWGFATVLIRIPELLESSGFKNLSSRGYEWILWRAHPDTRLPHIFAGTTDVLIEDSVQLTINIPNATWFLSIKPNAGWLSGHYDHMTLGIGAFLVIAGFGASFAFFLQRQPYLLQQQVELRTMELQETNSMLRDSELRLRQVIENNQSWIWEVDINGLYTFSSSAIENLLGYKIEEIVGKKHFFDLFYTEDREELKNTAFAIFKKRQPFLEYENRNLTKSGKIVWLSTSGVPIIDNSGNLLGYRGADINITDRRQAEEDLKKREKVLCESQEVANIGSYVLDLSTGAWTSSKVLADIFGLGKTLSHNFEDWNSIIHPGCQKEMIDYFTHVVIGQRRRFDKEYRIVRKTDGEERWVHGMGKLELNDKGVPTVMIGTIQDITERKLAEQILQISNQRFRSLFDNTEISIWDEDLSEVRKTLDRLRLEGVSDLRLYLEEHAQAAWDMVAMVKIIRVNEATLRLFGAKNEDEMLDKIGNTFGPAAIEVFIDELCAIWDNAKFFRAEVVFQTLHGRELNTIISFKIPESVEGYESIPVSIIDITERKLAEQEKKTLEAHLQQAHKMEAIGTMAGGIAHDFNNLLTIISGNIDIIQHKQNAGSPPPDNIDNIKNATKRATTLVKQILAFSRQEKPTLVSVDLASIINEAVKLLRSTIPATVEIMTTVDSDPIVINADTTQLQQVLINLCNNAAHAMNEKGLLQIKLEGVELAAGDLPAGTDLQMGRYAKLSIVDTGVGMDKATLDKIFDPFFTTKEIGEGTGMGLSVVHGIVEQHDGFISVDSELEMGTTFNVYFPIAGEVTAELLKETTEALPTGSERILFVDDEECIAYTCNELLECQGYRVTSVTSSFEALDIFKASPEEFDLVFTDQTMPEMSGAELAVELLKIRPDIPIILCSGFSSMVTEGDAREIGIREFCMKPMDMKQLAIVARRVLDGGATLA